MHLRLFLSAVAASCLTGPLTAEPTAVLDITKLQPQGETRVWSPLFQASWDKMTASHDGKLTKVVPPNQVIEKMQTFEWQEKSVMPPNGYAIFSGPDTPEFTKQVADKMREQFDMRLAPRSTPHNPASTAYYGVLSRDLTFKKKFYQSKKKPLTFTDGTGKTHKVQFFGTAGQNSDGYEKNIRVLHNDPAKKSFIFTVNTCTEGEKIIIFLPEKTLSFTQGIEEVLAAQKQPCEGKYGDATYPYILRDEIIKIPYVTIDIRTNLTSQLAGNRYYEGDPKPWFVSWAYQVTKFKLTEKGARIRLQTGMDDAFGGSPEPRKFICNRPFFIFAWRDHAKLPYFAAWIDGKEALLPFKG